MSWSADREAATCFARDTMRRCSIGGSVLLRTVAPPAACTPHVLGARRPSEAEYIVDRRQLSGGVTVLERFSHVSPNMVGLHEDEPDLSLSTQQ
jgi:hypothetical protein